MGAVIKCKFGALDSALGPGPKFSLINKKLYFLDFISRISNLNFTEHKYHLSNILLDWFAIESQP